MRRYKRLILTTAGIAFLLIPVKGQNTNSPYSRYGYGVLSDHAIGASQGMGGISYGVRGLNTNPNNPASYTSVDSLTFIFDLGVSYSSSRFDDGKSKQSDHNGGLDYVTMQFPIAKKLGMSIGLLPFSSVGYSLGSVDEQNGLNYQTMYDGSGGFSQVYIGLGYSPIKNLSIGANASYLFGNTTYSRSLTILNVTGANYEYWNNKLTLNGLKFDFGVQYELNLNKDNSLVLGAVYSPKYNKTGRIERVRNIYSSTGTVVSGDTAVFVRENADAQLASKYGFGFTWKHKNNIIVGADVTYQDWSKAKYSKYMEDDFDKLTNTNRFNDTWRFNAGLEYAIAPEERSFIKRMKFRGGLNFTNSYINVITADKQIGKYKEYGATLGFGIPVKDGGYAGKTSYININFEYKTLRPNLSQSNMVKEDYFGVSLNVNINEMWFLKNKFR